MGPKKNVTLSWIKIYHCLVHHGQPCTENTIKKKSKRLQPRKPKPITKKSVVKKESDSSTPVIPKETGSTTKSQPVVVLPPSSISLPSPETKTKLILPVSLTSQRKKKKTREPHFQVVRINQFNKPLPIEVIHAYREWSHRLDGVANVFHACSSECRFKRIPCQGGRLFLLCENSGEIHPCGDECDQSNESESQTTCDLTGSILETLPFSSSESGSKIVTSIKNRKEPEKERLIQ